MEPAAPPPSARVDSDEFAKRYAEMLGVPLAQLVAQGFAVEYCSCTAPTCLGWKASFPMRFPVGQGKFKIT